MRRLLARAFIIGLLSIMVASAAQAQLLPWDLHTDSSFRVGLLFGSQEAKYQPPSATSSDPYRMEYSPSLLVFSGACEISPLWRFSGRASGCASVGESNFDATIEAGVGGPIRAPWEVSPDYSQWEFAGLFHIWKAMGYRFSFVAGYREETWKYSGEPLGAQGAGSSFRDEFHSRVPFIALQTSMYQPWWKARFELLTSWFMDENISRNLRDGGQVVDIEGSGDQGGLIQFEAQGTAVLTKSLRFGVYGRYAYQELYGASNQYTTNSTAVPLRLYVGESIAVLGLDLTLVF